MTGAPWLLAGLLLGLAVYGGVLLWLVRRVRRLERRLRDLIIAQGRLFEMLTTGTQPPAAAPGRPPGDGRGGS